MYAHVSSSPIPTGPKNTRSDVESATSIIDKLLFLSPKRGLLYVTDTVDGTPSGNLEHLSCFLGGLLALGTATIPGLPKTHLWAAEGLTHTCWITYADTATGLGRAYPPPRPPKPYSDARAAQRT